MRPLLLIGLALITLGCHRRTIGHFGDGAFYHARGHYRVRYEPNAQRLLPSRWHLTNYAHDDDGRPTFARPEVHGFDRLETGWLGGRGRLTFAIPRVDLHYRDERGDAEIWARTMVIPRAWESVPTEPLMHTIVAALVDPSAPMDPLGRRFQPTQLIVRRSGDARVDGRPAYWIELDVTRGLVEQRVTVVGMHISQPWQVRRHGRFPMMVVFGFASAPEEHESVRRDFAHFVSRVDLAGGRGS